MPWSREGLSDFGMEKPGQVEMSHSHMVDFFQMKTMDWTVFLKQKWGSFIMFHCFIFQFFHRTPHFHETFPELPNSKVSRELSNPPNLWEPTSLLCPGRRGARCWDAFEHRICRYAMYGGFHSHGATPIYGCFMRENPIVQNGWWLGVALWKPPYGNIYHQQKPHFC